MTHLTWAATALAAGFLATACGPMPGYTPPPEESRRHRPEPIAPPAPRTAEARPEPGVRYEPTDPDPVDPAPPETVKVPAPEVEGDMQVIPLSGRDTYYLIDRQRGLCFLKHKGSLATVDCKSIPEASDLGDDESPPPETTDPARPDSPTPAPWTPPERGTTRRYETPSPPTPPAPTPAAPVTPPAPDAPTSAPSRDEVTRFETAYVDIFCDRRAGGTTAPREHIERQGLSIERYGEIEAWWAADQAAWWALMNKARRSCDGA